MRGLIIDKDGDASIRDLISVTVSLFFREFFLRTLQSEFFFILRHQQILNFLFATPGPKSIG